MRKLLLAIALVQAFAFAQPANVLYVTHSAGFRHDSLPFSQEVLRDLGARSGRFSVTATEDLSALGDLSRYRAVIFFTSGELNLSAGQKQGLLDFVKNGGGFAAIHSGTDTLYTWPEYGELVGGRFDGHPWTQEVRIDVEDTAHPATRHLGTSFKITDEIYQFREFSRERVRVLMTLDTSSVDSHAPGVTRTDDDFALAWTHRYGQGRVFYTALGHFDSTWQDDRFQRMLEEAVLWISGQTEGDGAPRPAVQTAIPSRGIGNAATMEPADTISRGSFVSIFGTNLTNGGSAAADVRAAPFRLAGTRVLINGEAVPVVYASPTQLNILAPMSLATTSMARITAQAAGSQPVTTQVALAPTTPGIFATSLFGAHAVLWSTGMGSVEERGGLSWTLAVPRVSVNGVEAKVTFSGLAPGWPGLYQVNLELPAGATAPHRFELLVP